jgi:hypothetical protein
MRHSMTAALVLALGMSASAGAVEVAGEAERIALRDGTVLIGRVLADDEATVRVVTADGVAVAATTGVDPNYSRLLFAPTGRPLAKGDGYFADYELLFPGFAYGLSDNVSISGGVSVVPGLGLGEQVFYVSPKIGWNVGDRGAVAVGGLFARAGSDGAYDDEESLGIGYAVGTVGGRARSLSLGLGAVKASDGGDPTPLLMVGGAATVSKRVGLVGETWLRLDGDFDAAEQPVGLGVRFFGDRLSADVGVILVGELLDEGFPLPWLSITYHFGAERLRP